MEKQKKDISIYYPMAIFDKDDNFKRVPMAYSFKGIMETFDNPEEAFLFYKGSFLTEKECEEYCQLLNNPKKNMSICLN